MPESPVMTLGEIAKRYGCTQGQVRKVFTRGFLPEPPRAGPYRVVPRGQLGQVEAALRKAGYLKETPAASTSPSPGQGY
jgi:hypothetical protein